MSIYQFIRNMGTEKHVKRHHRDATHQILTVENSTRHNQFCQQIKLEFFGFIFWQMALNSMSFLKSIQNGRQLRRNGYIQLRQGKARQPILRLKNKVMAVSENPFWAKTILETATISIPGWNQVSLSQCFSNLVGVKASGDTQALPYAYGIRV